MKENVQEAMGHRIRDIIDTDFKVEDDEGYVDGDIRVRFESVIEFPYFLIHTLKVFVNLYGVEHENLDAKITDELLDDKKLLDAFNRVVSHGVTVEGHSADNKEEFSRRFIICLLRTRYLFDKYIVKREYANDNTDGEWSLKSLYVSGQQSKKKPYYRNTKFTKFGEWASTNDWRTKTNIMIQSALRVSYTSPKVMHWITKLLAWLSEDDCKHIKNDDITRYDEFIERIAIDAVKENFFKVCEDGVYVMGANTPHIVFNYLDYLLWYYNRKKYDDFVFEFRNSVEHWYPQNPSEGTFEQWKDGVDQFGNLCIIQRNINSRFSNMSPEAKKSTFKDMIAKGSIKLRIMSELTEKNGDKVASVYWKETMYKKHEEEMLKYLMDACEIDWEDND
ncbi:MAG: HNH endonuclease family protein [Lachnospiraceae bacterium]|nr:HNH endonuclease family protein [Lachnospiraceae bacterium]